MARTSQRRNRSGTERLEAFKDLQSVFGRPFDQLLLEEQWALVGDVLDLFYEEMEDEDEVYDAAKELRRRLGGARLDTYVASLMAGRRKGGEA